jgi:hypothetical protein
MLAVVDLQRSVKKLACRRGREIAGNFLMQHGCFSPQSGEKPCSINVGQLTLKQLSLTQPVLATLKA